MPYNFHHCTGISDKKDGISLLLILEITLQFLNDFQYLFHQAWQH